MGFQSVRFLRGVLACCMVCFLGVSARAAIIDLPTTANAYVLRSAATTDQNEAETLVTKGTGTDNTNTRLIFLRFDTSSLFLEPANELVSAVLRLYHVSTSSGTPSHTLQVYGLVNGAGETTWTNSMTWDTRASGTTNIPNSNTTSSFGSLPVSNTTPAGEINVTLDAASFSSFLNANTNNEITLILGTTNSGSPNTNLASLTNTSGFLVPTLQLNVQPIPEPGTFALLGIAGGLALLRWRRCRL